MSSSPSPQRPGSATSRFKFRNPTRAFTMSPHPASPSTMTGRTTPTRSSTPDSFAPPPTTRSRSSTLSSALQRRVSSALAPSSTKANSSKASSTETVNELSSKTTELSIATEEVPTEAPEDTSVDFFGRVRALLGSIVETESPISIPKSDDPVPDSPRDDASINSRSPSRLRRQVSNLSRRSVSSRRFSFLGPSSPPQVETTPIHARGEMQKSLAKSPSLSSFRRHPGTPEPWLAEASESASTPEPTPDSEASVIAPAVPEPSEPSPQPSTTESESSVAAEQAPTETPEEDTSANVSDHARALSGSTVETEPPMTPPPTQTEELMSIPNSDDPVSGHTRDAGILELHQSRVIASTQRIIGTNDGVAALPTLWQVPEQNSAPRATDAGTGTDTETTIVRSEGIIRTKKMTTEKMFQCLKQHGCPDLTESINPSAYSRNYVATGGFGDIWKGKLYDETVVAVKVWRFRTVDEDPGKDIKRAMREIYNWSQLNHDNIQKLLGVVVFDGRLGMVSKWMEEGNLQHYLENNLHVDRYPLCTQMAQGVEYLHDRDMIHGDLKAINVLVSLDHKLKLTDFDYSIMAESTLQFSQTTRMGGGTLRWMAPELALDEEGNHPRNKKTDIYALGMTFLETITGAVPYAKQCKNDGGIYSALHRKQFPRRDPSYFGSERGNRMWALLEKCWDHNPAARPIASEVTASLQKLIKETESNDAT